MGIAREVGFITGDVNQRDWRQISKIHVSPQVKLIIYTTAKENRRGKEKELVNRQQVIE